MKSNYNMACLSPILPDSGYFKHLCGPDIIVYFLTKSYHDIQLVKCADMFTITLYQKLQENLFCPLPKVSFIVLP